MISAHRIVGLAVLATAIVATCWGAFALARASDAALGLRHVLALVQTLLIAQVALGLLLLGDERRAGDDLHYLYGFLSLGVILAPWLYAPVDPRRRLAWFVGATLVAGALAVRAYTTAG